MAMIFFFSNVTPKVQTINEVIDKFYFMKIKNFFSSKDNVLILKRQIIDWKKMFAKDKM